jgi:hypothetical protein
MMTVPQLEMFTGSGLMKSLRAAVKESEDRLFRYALPKEVQPAVPSSCVKSIDASPKVRAERAPSPAESPSAIAEVLIDPVASRASVRLMRLPQHGNELLETQSAVEAASFRYGGSNVESVSQNATNRTGVVPPLERSYWMSRSPSVRRRVVAGVHGRLVELEVHVRRAGGVLDAGPVEMDEVLRRGLLAIDPEGLQVALVRRDAAVDLRRDGGVLLGAVAERVVAGAGREVVLAGLGDVRPVQRRWCGVIDHQVRVGVDLELAAGEADLGVGRLRGSRDQRRPDEGDEADACGDS